MMDEQKELRTRLAKHAAEEAGVGAAPRASPNWKLLKTATINHAQKTSSARVRKVGSCGDLLLWLFLSLWLLWLLGCSHRH